VTPDPNIMKAATIADLMNVLRAAPYNLDVPQASDFPPGSALRDLWSRAITVAADVGTYEYVATSTTSWTIMPNISVSAPNVLISAASSEAAAAAVPRPVQRAPRRRSRRTARQPS
jgi:hypothetical protein